MPDSDAMSGSDALRRRLIGAGVDLPDALLDLIAASVDPLIGGLDELARLDLGTIEPFVPGRQLVDDAEP